MKNDQQLVGESLFQCKSFTVSRVSMPLLISVGEAGSLHLFDGKYGPGGGQDIVWSETLLLTISNGQAFTARFSFAGWYEKTINIYTSPSLQSLIERGNYDRSTQDWGYPKQSSQYNLLLTAWNKNSDPNASYPWHTSYYNQIERLGESSVMVSWHDIRSNPRDVRNSTVIITGESRFSEAP